MLFKRPWLVGAMFEFLLVLVVVNAARAVNAIRLWDYLAEIPLTASPLYMLITGVLWALRSLWVGWWVWQGKPQAPRALRWTITGYAFYFWADQLFLRVNPLRETNWPFMFALTAFVVLFTFLGLTHPNVVAFYEVKDE